MLFQLCLRTVRTLILYVLNLLLKKLLHFLRDTDETCNDHHQNPFNLSLS
uniref:Uncharacterized protein n=1 Tax=Lepeophtheirus salmonis TaxID=72036 RepID=A0A0K2U038_LEPSM